MMHEATTPGLRAGIETLIAAATDRVDTDKATPYDGFASRDEIQNSGYLEGVLAGLEIANQLIGGSSPEYLIRHNLPDVESEADNLG
jgi:hypothetical protein